MTAGTLKAADPISALPPANRPAVTAAENTSVNLRMVGTFFLPTGFLHGLFTAENAENAEGAATSASTMSAQYNSNFEFEF
jgi:hypothetical protein